MGTCNSTWDVNVVPKVGSDVVRIKRGAVCSDDLEFELSVANCDEGTETQVAGHKDTTCTDLKWTEDITVYCTCIVTP